MEAGPEEVNLVVLSLVPTIGLLLIGDMDVTSVSWLTRNVRLS